MESAEEVTSFESTLLPFLFLTIPENVQMSTRFVHVLTGYKPVLSHAPVGSLARLLKMITVHALYSSPAARFIT